jgi:hypothetical protein
MFLRFSQPERHGAAPLDSSFFFTQAHSHSLESEMGLGHPFERIRLTLAARRSEACGVMLGDP